MDVNLGQLRTASYLTARTAVSAVNTMTKAIIGNSETSRYIRPGAVSKGSTPYRTNPWVGQSMAFAAAAVQGKTAAANAIIIAPVQQDFHIIVTATLRRRRVTFIAGPLR